MMKSEGKGMRYRAPGPDVVSQEFPDETIVIRLDTGTYYSLNPAAAALWRLSCAGHTLAEVIEACRVDRPADPEIAAVWARLVEAELVRPAPLGTDVPGRPPATALAAPPHMTEYADMQDLFALDPVHDVDESGWPSTQPLSATPAE
ncbi:MAG: PqqD family protein [Bryobacteraceae bacterium]